MRTIEDIREPEGEDPEHAKAGEQVGPQPHSLSDDLVNGVRSLALSQRRFRARNQSRSLDSLGLYVLRTF